MLFGVTTLASINLDQQLDLLLEDEGTNISDDVYNKVLNAAVELSEAKKRVDALERELAVAIDRLSGGLALAVRKNQPSLNVNLGFGGCRVSYLKKNLTLKPDIERQIWSVDSSHPKFGSKFKRMYGHLLHFNSDLSPLAAGIAEFFTRYYRSINESISGVGSVVICDSTDSRRISLGKLAELLRAKDEKIGHMKVEVW